MKQNLSLAYNFTVTGQGRNERLKKQLAKIFTVNLGPGFSFRLYLKAMWWGETESCSSWQKVKVEEGSQTVGAEAEKGKSAVSQSCIPSKSHLGRPECWVFWGPANSNTNLSITDTECGTRSPYLFASVDAKLNFGPPRPEHTKYDQLQN